MSNKNQLEHIAFIMDGNGRWAKQRKLARTNGHLEGAKRISEIILACKKHKIKEATFFAFSTENWSRPKAEVKFLLKLLEKYLIDKNLKWFKENNVKINLIGFEHKAKHRLFKKINKFCEKTKDNNAINVNICFNYSSRLEIVNAAKQLIEKKLSFTEENFNECLLIKKQVDLLIRTSGEKRISNFLLWQISYAEIIFEKTFWPDYKINILEKNIKEFYKRDRRFGKINEEQ